MQENDSESRAGGEEQKYPSIELQTTPQQHTTSPNAPEVAATATVTTATATSNTTAQSREAKQPHHKDAINHSGRCSPARSSTTLETFT